MCNFEFLTRKKKNKKQKVALYSRSVCRRKHFNKCFSELKIRIHNYGTSTQTKIALYVAVNTRKYCHDSVMLLFLRIALIAWAKQTMVVVLAEGVPRSQISKEGTNWRWNGIIMMKVFSCELVKESNCRYFLNCVCTFCYQPAAPKKCKLNATICTEEAERETNWEKQ